MFSILPKKRTETIRHSSKVEFFFVRFLGELKIPKRHFEINWPLEHQQLRFFQSLNHQDGNLKVRLLNKNGYYIAIISLTPYFRRLQSQLPDGGAKFSMNDTNNLVAVKRSLPDQFADHVVDKTQKDWKYWVFTSIMGHFVHSFAQEVSADSPDDLETTSLEWITNSMSLQQLRKGLYLKTFS